MKSKKGQLVCQHLENVSRDALGKYGDIIKDYVRGRHGIYALFRRKNLYYVGLASNLRGRLNSHLKDSHAQSWDRFSVYLTIQNEHTHELEALVMRIAAPKGNRQTGKLIRSQDLGSEFRNDIKTYYQKEIDILFGTSKKKVAEKVISANGKQPILAPFVKKRFQIRFKWKGKLHKATVRKDGSIFFKGKLYNSPSSAAHEILRHAANGWTLWKYERAPGDWVHLDTLRKK